SGCADLHRFHLYLPGGRHRSAGGDDRCDSAHPPSACRRAQAGHHPSEHAQAAGRRRAGEAPAGPGHRIGEGPKMIGLGHYLVVAAMLFVIGVLGIFVNRKNVIIILMSVELILLSVNINLVAFSSYLGDMVGQVFTMFVLTVAAAEAAIGLAILVAYFRNRGSIAVEDINMMKG